MCCDERAGAAPALVGAMLSEYRTLSAERRYDWGGENESVARGQAYARWLGPRILAAVFAPRTATGRRPSATASSTRCPPA